MRLSDADAAFLYQETASGPMHSCVFNVVEGVLPFDEYFDLVESSIHLIPRYRQRLAFVPYNLAHPKWVDDPDFKLENHIKPYSVPPGSTVEDVVAAVLELAEPLLPRDRPLWLTYVVEGVTNRTVLAQLGHHAFMDGSTVIDISLTLFDLQARRNPPKPPEKPWNPEPVPTSEALITEAIMELGEEAGESNAFAAAARLGARRELTDRALGTVARLFTKPAITAPWNAGPIGRKRSLICRKFAFRDLRTIRRAFGGTINDVVLTLVTESAARYLEAHGEPVREGDFLRIMCPVNVRREGETGTIGNRVSGIFPCVPAEIDARPRAPAISHRRHHPHQGKPRSPGAGVPHGFGPRRGTRGYGTHLAGGDPVGPDRSCGADACSDSAANGPSPSFDRIQLHLHECPRRAGNAVRSWPPGARDLFATHAGGKPRFRGLHSQLQPAAFLCFRLRPPIDARP